MGPDACQRSRPAGHRAALSAVVARLSSCPTAMASTGWRHCGGPPPSPSSSSPPTRMTRSDSRPPPAGADDYLLISRIDGYWLPRALARAIERRLSEDALFSETERVEVTLNSHGRRPAQHGQFGPCQLSQQERRSDDGLGRAPKRAAGRSARCCQIVDSTTREPAADPIAAAVPADPVPTFVSNSILIRRDGSECQCRALGGDDSRSPRDGDRRGDRAP